MFDNEYRPDTYNSSNASIWAIITDSKMPNFVLNHLNYKKMCKHAVQKLSLVTRYVYDSYRTQKMYGNAIQWISATLKSFCSSLI